MSVLWVFMDAVRIVPTPMAAMCAVATLDTKSLPITECVWVRRYTVNGQLNIICSFVCTKCTVDIDECALGINGCNQICTNTIGSYVCSCYIGYQISSNRRTCMGKKTYHLCYSLLSCCNKPYVVLHISQE